MTISRKVVCWSLFFFLPTAYSLYAQGKPPQDPRESCRKFVQKFYDQGASVEYSLRYKPHILSPELFRLLKDDYEAQSRVEGEIAGLQAEADLFRNSQDPGDRYVVGNIRRKGESFWVEVYGIWGGKKSKRPDIVPEVILKNGRWVFVNFHYYDYEKGKITKHNDLVRMLKLPK